MALTADRARELLDYSPSTGSFMWRTTGRGRRADRVAGHVGRAGYVQIGIGDTLYLAHRLAWLIVHGEWPKHHIDHMDGNPLNNTIANLRDVPRDVNCQNVRTTHKARGLLGAHRNHSKWAAKIRVGGKQIHLGNFATEAEAHECYVAAKRQLHQGNTL